MLGADPLTGDARVGVLVDVVCGPHVAAPWAGIGQRLTIGH